MSDSDPIKAWFCGEILPLEPALTRYIRRNWRNEADIAELRQEAYARVLESARSGIPANPKAYLVSTARNHLINCVRRARIVSFDLVADLESAMVGADTLTPERVLGARDELRRVQQGLDRMPPRRREVVMLRKIEGLSQKEIAARTGISLSAVEQQLTRGMKSLVDFMLGGEPHEAAPVRSRKAKRS